MGDVEHSFWDGVRGYVAFTWNAMDAWLEENEEVFVHPRDPHHRVDVLRSSRHVRARRLRTHAERRRTCAG